jgi:hypothetical protein
MHLHSEEGSRDVDLFASDEDDLLAIEDLLCDDGSQSSHKVTCRFQAQATMSIHHP